MSASVAFHELYGYALGLELRNFPMTVVEVLSYEVAAGIARCWNMERPEDVI